MKKIAVVIPKYGLVGGAERFVAILTEKLRSWGPYDFTVLANRWQTSSGSIHFLKTPMITFPKFLTTLSFAWFAKRRIASAHFDLVHTHDRIFQADLYTLHGIPHRYWIDQVRKKRFPSLYDRATVWMENQLVRHGGCRSFVAVSQLTREIFLKTYPMDPDRVTVIHPGVAAQSCPTDDRLANRATIRKRYGIGRDETVLIFASMNFEIKGLDSIIAALAKLRGRDAGCRLIVAGKGDQGKYARLAANAGVGRQVIFTGGLTPEDLSCHYLACDGYIMLSAFDTFGMVVLEAMAAGLPVIVSANVGAKDVVVEGQNGFVIDHPTHASLVASRIQTLLNPVTRQSMSRAAMNTAAANTWEVSAKKYAKLYQTLLEARKS